MPSRAPVESGSPSPRDKDRERGSPKFGRESSTLRRKCCRISDLLPMTPWLAPRRRPPTSSPPPDQAKPTSASVAPTDRDDGARAEITKKESATSSAAVAPSRRRERVALLTDLHRRPELGICQQQSAKKNWRRRRPATSPSCRQPRARVTTAKAVNADASLRDLSAEDQKTAIARARENFKTVKSETTLPKVPQSK